MESYKEGRLYKSSSQTVTLLEYLPTKNGYVNNLNSATDDFYSEGFTLDTPAGFDNNAYHSPHPYDNLTDYVLILRVPIVVAPSNAILTYDDIAIVEEGDPGTEFGDEGFWDYVIVEASNGTDWIPLADGYDARADSDWLNAYQNSLAGNSSLFRTQTVNLLNTFSAGDTVVIRFRLSADPFVTGWGWAIDNISIQPTLVGIENVSAIPERFELSQNYPNPFNPTTTISYRLPSAGKVTLRIFDIKGSEVARIDEDQKPAGNYKINFDASDLASGVYIYRLTAGDFTAQKKMVLLK